MSTQAPGRCYCYILECADGSYYTGWTTDPDKRLEAHNAGRGARYTRARRPVRIVMLEMQADRISAMRRERAIKQMRRSRKAALIDPGIRKPARRGAGTGKRRARLTRKDESSS